MNLASAWLPDRTTRITLIGVTAKHGIDEYRQRLAVINELGHVTRIIPRQPADQDQ